MIVQKYCAPSGSASAHIVLLSDVSHDDSYVPTSIVIPTQECNDEYDGIGVSVPFSSVAFSSSLIPGRDLSQCWVVDMASLTTLTAFRSDFVTSSYLRALFVWVVSVLTFWATALSESGTDSYT
jgi:hypothetical protein